MSARRAWLLSILILTAYTLASGSVIAVAALADWKL